MSYNARMAPCASADLPQLLDALERFYGRQPRPVLRDPYRMVLHRICGYPQSDVNCDRGYAALRAQIGLAPAQILGTTQTQLASALRAGGIVPELRARRLQEIAARVQDEFGGSLRRVLKLTAAKAIAVLQSFPTLGRPGAEKILLYNLAPVAAVPANCLHVPLRLRIGHASRNWAAGYKSAQSAIAAALADDAPGQLRAYLLLQRHGKMLCKANRPRCDRCPVRSACSYYGSTAN